MSGLVRCFVSSKPDNGPYTFRYNTIRDRAPMSGPLDDNPEVIRELMKELHKEKLYLFPESFEEFS